MCRDVVIVFDDERCHGVPFQIGLETRGIEFRSHRVPIRAAWPDFVYRRAEGFATALKLPRSVTQVLLSKLAGFGDRGNGAKREGASRVGFRDQHRGTELRFISEPDRKS